MHFLLIPVSRSSINCLLRIDHILLMHFLPGNVQLYHRYCEYYVEESLDSITFFQIALVFSFYQATNLIRLKLPTMTLRQQIQMPVQFFCEGWLHSVPPTPHTHDLWGGQKFWNSLYRDFEKLLPMPQLSHFEIPLLLSNSHNCLELCQDRKEFPSSR